MSLFSICLGGTRPMESVTPPPPCSYRIREPKFWNKITQGEKKERKLNIIIESNVLQSVSGLSGGKNKAPNAPNLQEKQALESLPENQLNTAFYAKNN
jgi:hypothetical protein